MSVLKILNKLAETPSRNDKEDILLSNKNNEDLKQAFRLALDSRISFYLTPDSITLPTTTSRGANNRLNLTDAMTAMGELSSRKVTGHAAIQYMNELLQSVSKDDAEVLVRVLDKSLACGVSESTVNKIWKGLVFSWPCMLASKNDLALVQRVSWPAIVQVKHDGMRFVAIANPQDGTVDYRSRSGKYVDVAREDLNLAFVAMARAINEKKASVFDGELLVVNAKTGEPLDRKTGNGILNKAVKGTISPQERALVRAVVWDVLPADVFLSGESYGVIYANRLATLHAAISSELTESFQTKTVQMIDSHEAKDLPTAQKLFEDYLALGQEGIILKDANGIWEDKRAKHQIKFKAERDCDLLCVEWQEGTGKYKGLLGSLVLESADRKICVSVGTGLSDELRNKLKPKDVVGKIIAVKYNERIQSKNRTEADSLFLPVFLDIREDKKKADSSKSIS
jgi:ATP-dependent DNA ligase